MSNNVVEAFADNVRWVVRIAAKRRWLVIGVASVLGLVSGVVIASLHNRYEASARVYVDTETVLKPLMAGLTFQPDIDQQVRMLARTLISRPNVESLVALPELKFDVSSGGKREEAIAMLMDQIKVVPTMSGNLYEVSYKGTDPDTARRIVEATVNMFMHAGVGAKKRDSQGAGRFIEDQIHHYEAKLVEAEDRLKDFKARNFGVTGVSNQDYFARVSTLTDEVTKLRVDLSAAEKARDAYRRELASENPQLPMELPARNGALGAAQEEDTLGAQHKRLDELLTQYTEAHPEVIRLRRLIAGKEAELKGAKGDAGRASGNLTRAATSPVYQQLRISLADTEAKVAALRSQLAAQEGRLERVRAVAGRVPQVEAELAQLNRDYDVIRKNYDQMVARREAASLGVKLDESAQLAEFRVIEPARASRKPAFPSRLHLAVLALIACLGSGLAVAVLADLIWPTFDDAASLRRFSKRPVLGTVPVLKAVQS